MSAPIPGSHEDDVRRYLLLLEDPTRLIDEDAVAAKAAEVSAAGDPIEKLRLMAELQRLREVNEAEVLESFLSSAKPWAEENGIPAAAFAELGVSVKVLQEAGFEIGGRRRAERNASQPRRSGRRRSSPEEIDETLTSLPGAFTIAEAAAKVGASPASVRKALDSLVAAGRLVRLPPDPNRRARGRAPGRFAGPDHA